MASLDEARDDYADENLPVLLLLGLVSALRRLEPLLPEPEPLSAWAEPWCAPGSGRFLYLVLGLAAFRGHLLAALPPPHEPGATDVSSGAGTRSETPALRELLR